MIKLYQITKKKEYLELSRHFLDCRGDSTKRQLWGPYQQDHLPVTRQSEAVGHAVRAAYMYAGMTDIAAIYRDSAYKNAVERIWNNVVNKKMYITGSIGSRHDGEAFGEDYELPNLEAYGETCAAIANVYWNYRMFLLSGDSKYIDVLERSLYNGVISGIALDGEHFFYPNPLSCNMKFQFNRGHLERQPWFDCSCCPTNICRFIPSVPGYIYAVKNNDLYINLFVQSSTKIKIGNTDIEVSQTTQYPWEGNVKLNLFPATKTGFTVKLRIPEWLSGKPFYGDLYRDSKEAGNKPIIKINGKEVDFKIEKGFATFEREWQKGDVVELLLPMEVRKVIANEKVESDKGKVAIERGPIVYCIEEKDNPEIDDLQVAENTKFTARFDKLMLKGIEVIEASGDSRNEKFTAIPYFVWNNRGANKMNVWLTGK